MRRVLLCALIALAALPATGLAGVDPDGRYAGKILGRDGKPGKTRITFRVSKDGRRITKLKTTTVAFCIGARIEDNRFNVLSVFIRGIKVGANGRFKGTSKPTSGGGTEFKFKGRRAGRKVRGEIDVRVVNCHSNVKFRATRAGP